MRWDFFSYRLSDGCKWPPSTRSLHNAGSSRVGVLEVALARANLRGFWDLMEDLFSSNLTQQGELVTTEEGMSASQTSSHPPSPGELDIATPTQPGEVSRSSRNSPPLKKSHSDNAGSETSVVSFPPLKPLAEVTSCYPSKVGSFHNTRIPSELRPVCAPNDQSFYKCPYSSCPKDSHNRGTICSHIGQVHLGVCPSCYICGWWPLWGMHWIST